jgi:porin
MASSYTNGTIVEGRGHRYDGPAVLDIRMPSPLAAALVALALTTAAAAQDGDSDRHPSDRGDARDNFLGAPEDVLRQLTDVQFNRTAITKYDPFTWLRGYTQELNTRLDYWARVRIGFAWTAVYQHATEARGPRNAASGDFDFFGRWRPLQTRDMLGYVIWSTQVRHELGTDITPRNLGDSIGSLWGTVNGFNIQSFNIRQLYWQHFLFDNTWTYRIGKIDQSNVLNNNRLQSDNLFFLNQAFSDNPTMAYPDNGFGIDTIWRPDDFYYLAGGISDASGAYVTDRVEKGLEDASWFMAGEVGLTPWIDGFGGGKHRFTAWYTDAKPESGEPAAWGFSYSGDQDLGDRLIGFLRYGWTNGTLTDTEQILSGGLGVKNPWGTSDDFAGLALGWGRPSDPTRRDQYVVEAFYRSQVTPAIQVTPDIQLIWNPSNAPQTDYSIVAGIRVRIMF